MRLSRKRSGATGVRACACSLQNGATIVDLEAALQLGGAADLFASLARRAVRQRVDENLTTLKTMLEAAR